ncbi:hypothetical protein C1752_04991 [Acaryochloris thomasi RCC1774]|uniref:Uncharacterized protein n=1 Tax=Acaryochloris thomasi RCC1774 TaxID=1764569 RepID=A0A2W1JC71_9CYAN|nr:O-antigen ligase domain-containing protein [Acaryochloris thomasi]PZD71610.1 hypothetical protein C1752_04991 [Acaryochloris thomasi RCC1774]
MFVRTANPSIASTSPDFKKSWILIVGFVGLMGLSLAAGVGKAAALLFPVGSLYIACFFYFRMPHYYVGFTWWLWFIGPFVRRLIDFREGGLTPGDFVLTPLLVTWVSAITFFRYLPYLYDKKALPFLLCISSVVYAFIVGTIQGNPLNANTYGTLKLLGPIFFGFHLFLDSPNYPKYRKVFLSVFLWGLIVMGVYGIFQRLILPQWDQLYLLHIEKENEVSQGVNSAFGLFSTAEGRQQFAGLIFPGLLLMLCHAGKSLPFIASIFGYLNFLLSRARAGWVSWLISMAIFLPSLKPQRQVRIILLISVSIAVMIPLSLTEPFSGFITERLGSLTDLSGDNSIGVRRAAYNALFGEAIKEVIGRGVGFDLSRLTKISTFDGAILPMMFWLGWIGITFFAAGIYLLLWKVFSEKKSQNDDFASASRAIAIGLFFQVGLNLIFISTLAMVFWGFAGISLAANAYYRGILEGVESELSQ